MMRTLDLSVECAGCATVCLHCWARGHRYAQMPLADIQFVLDSARQFCTTNDVHLAPYPMHDVLLHPDASAIMRLFQSAAREPLFEPLPTTGVPLMLRADWQAILETARELGTETLWFAFHGMGDVHDQVVGYPGAYQLCLAAVQRARLCGLACGANIFVTMANIPQLPGLFATLDAAGVTQYACEVAGFSPLQRLRRYEALRPTLPSLTGVAALIAVRSTFHQDWWRNLAQATEAYYYQQACAPDPDNARTWASPTRGERCSLVCRPNLDLHTGWAGLPSLRHGNLRTEDTQAVFARAITAPSPFKDAVEYYFTRTDEPAIAELARQAGTPDGEQVYMDASEMRLKWLDSVWNAYRKH